MVAEDGYDFVWATVTPLLTHAHEGVYYRSHGSATEYRYLNPAGEQLLGCTLDDLREDPDYLLKRVHPDGQPVLERARSDPDSVPWPIEMQFRHRDGAYITLALREVVLRDEDGQVLGVAGMFHHTQRADSSDDASLRAALAREQAISDRFRRLDEMRQGFLRAVSHELRTPLTAILGYSDTLMTHRDQLGQPQVDQVIGRIMDNAQRLRVMLEDLLDIDRMSRGTLTLSTERVELTQVVIRVVDQYPAGHVRLRSEPVEVDVEPARIERVVDNLVHNGLKHGGKATTVWVSVTAEPDWAVLTVEDDGHGFGENVLDRVFTAFEQGDETRLMPSPGAGLGLTFVNEVVALHGGTVSVANRDEGGARVIVRLPRPA